MAKEGFKRKLAAILSADVKGYSRLMGEDEEATIHTLTEYRKIISDQVKQHEGRVVDSPGDNVLAEFASVVDALKCAVDTQKEIAEQNESLPENRKMMFRIGVNLGDVAEEGERIYGDGVNVAARIEGLADPGGICISRSAYDQIRKRLSLGYEYLGEHSVKNIDEPVRVYRVLTAPEYAGRVIGEKTAAGKKWRRLAYAAVACLIVVAGGLIAWNIYLQKSRRVEPADIEKMAFPLPDKPSIAVLPFKNLSNDPAQDYIAVGITENIISALSNISDMFVIASDSTSTYKGKAVKIQQVSEELGVRYVLEGSAQKSGNRVRVTAQLIDATTGHYLWTEKYDRELQDLFDLQDEITHRIIVELQVKLTEGEQARVSQKSTTNLEAWSYANRGLTIWMHISKENNTKAMELFKQAVELDPNYVWAWVRLAWTHVVAADRGWSQNPSEDFKIFLEISKKVLAMDESNSDVHALLGLAYLLQKEPEKAIAEGEKAIVLGPTNAQAHVLLAVTMNDVGRFDEAIRLVEKAMRLHPYYPAYYLSWLGGGYRMTGRYEDALTVYKQLLDRSQKGEFPAVDAHLYLVELYTEMGREDEARAHAAEIFKIEPGFSLKRIRSINSFDYQDPALLERRLKVLRKAGLSD
jgi:adenylate cyclase